ncbi:zeta toxin family protein [Erythrobacter sp. JK5]|nr:zeta toxin family protein [Erythrobacter sp. JK5]
MFLIAGPNGAGKTTFYDTVLKARVNAPFVNADIIQRDELRDPSLDAAYTAARIAGERREEYIRQGASFVMETVFSHPSKLELLASARDAGFRLIVFHLNVATPDLAVARVKARISEGGHEVPEHKIRERFERNQALIRQAALMADRALVFDSSALNERPRVLLELRQGRAVRIGDDLPDWFLALYAHPDMRD